MKLNYTPLTREEWRKVEEIALSRFEREVLPEKPTFKSVAKRSPESFNINVLEWAMTFLLAVILVFVGFKGGIASVTYVDGLVDRLAHGKAVFPVILLAMKAVGILLYSLLPAIAIIYAKITHDMKAKEREETAIREKTRMGNRKSPGKFKTVWLFIWDGYFLSLDWWTPRLWLVIVIFGIGWLAQISWLGWEYFFMWVIPLVIEVSASYTVAKILYRYRQYVEAVLALLSPKLEDWEQNLHNYRNHGGYYRMVMDELREALRDKSTGSWRDRSYPNRLIFDDPGRIDDVQEIVKHEFKRWHIADDTFTQEAIAVENAIVEQDEVYIIGTQQDTDADGRIIPPNGAGRWTEEALRKSLGRIGVVSDGKGNYIRQQGGEVFNQSHLDAEYANGYSVRSVFSAIRRK